MLSNTIRIGHSPDPDDAFMFYGFACREVTIPGYEIEHVLNDIQSLNRMAAGSDPLEVTAMSAHAFFGLDDRFQLLSVGTSVGRGYGPRVVARRSMDIQQLEGLRVALPGPLTTATLVARHLLPRVEEHHVPFTEIMDRVLSGEFDAGVIIHEGQLTYASLGLHLVADLGEEYANRHDGLPLPLGVNCVRKDLPEKLKGDIESAYLRSVHLAIHEKSAEAVEYARGFGRGLSTSLTDQFVRMYVNQDSLKLQGDVLRSLDILRSAHASQQEAHLDA